MKIDNKNPFDDAPVEIKRLSTFLDSFYKETDRGSAMMAGAVIDDVLKEIIENFLIESKESQQLLDGFNAPLGTFSSRALAAYSLGLIEDYEFKEIEIIRKIRNQFGHTWNETTFASPKIKKEIEKFPFQEKNTRSTFNQAVANLLGELLWRAIYAKRERRATKIWPNKGGFLKRQK